MVRHSPRSGRLRLNSTARTIPRMISPGTAMMTKMKVTPIAVVTFES